MQIDNPKVAKVGSYIDVPPAKPAEATVFVAASDARSEVKKMADLVCKGAHDETTIQKAIDMLPSSGGTVKLSEGTFIIDAHNIILRSNIAIEGSGFGTLLKPSGDYYPLVVGDGSTTLTKIKIANLAIDMSNTEARNGVRFYGRSDHRITNVVVTNVYVYNSRYTSIFAYYVSNGLFQGNIIDTTRYLVGIGLYYCENCTIVGNTMYNTNIEGICLGRSNNCTVVGNTVDTVVDGKYGGIRGYYGENNTITGNTIRNCSPWSMTLRGSKNYVVSSNVGDNPICVHDTENTFLIGNIPSQVITTGSVSVACFNLG